MRPLKPAVGLDEMPLTVYMSDVYIIGGLP